MRFSGALSGMLPLAFSVLAMAGGFYIGILIGTSVGSFDEQVATTESAGADGGSEMDLVVRGERVYAQFGCANCHGAAGEGGVANPNAATGELVPSIVYVREAYTPEELKTLIRKGVPVIVKLDPAGPAPPLFMPPWEGAISSRDLEALVQFLFQLYPEEEELDW